jgi:hypothetical protein
VAPLLGSHAPDTQLPGLQYISPVPQYPLVEQQLRDGIVNNKIPATYIMFLGINQYLLSK